MASLLLTRLQASKRVFFDALPAQREKVAADELRKLTDAYREVAGTLTQRERMSIAK